MRSASHERSAPNGQVMNKKILKATLLPLILSLAASVAIAQPFQKSDIVDAITGKSSMSEKKELGKLFVLFADLSQSPQRIRLDNIVAATGTGFNEPMCSRQNTGVNVCAYQNPNWDIKTFAVTNLRTFSKASEGDAGADLRMQIARKFACIPSRAMERFWGVKPLKGPTIIPDSFADTRKLDLIFTESYRGVNPATPYVYVETRSIEGCVVDVSLSAIRPPIQ